MGFFCLICRYFHRARAQIVQRVCMGLDAQSQTKLFPLFLISFPKRQAPRLAWRFAQRVRRVVITASDPLLNTPLQILRAARFGARFALGRMITAHCVHGDQNCAAISTTFLLRKALARGARSARRRPPLPCLESRRPAARLRPSARHAGMRAQEQDAVCGQLGWRNAAGSAVGLHSEGSSQGHGMRPPRLPGCFGIPRRGSRWMDSGGHFRDPFLSNMCWHSSIPPSARCNSWLRGRVACGSRCARCWTCMHATEFRSHAWSPNFGRMWVPRGLNMRPKFGRVEGSGFWSKVGNWTVPTFDPPLGGQHVWRYRGREVPHGASITCLFRCVGECLVALHDSQGDGGNMLGVLHSFGYTRGLLNASLWREKSRI